MKKIYLGNAELQIFDEQTGVRVKSDAHNVILSDQNAETVFRLIIDNFSIVNSYYEGKIPPKLKHQFNSNDISEISISTLLHYLYMYNSWRTTYKNKDNIDLKFKPSDLDNPSTHDIIFAYFKSRYPENWEEKCSILLGMNLDELRSYYMNRQYFYNK